MLFNEYLNSREDQNLFEQSDIPMKLLSEQVQISEGLKYHLENNLSLANTVYRYGSDAYYNLVKDRKSTRLNSSH